MQRTTTITFLAALLVACGSSSTGSGGSDSEFIVSGSGSSAASSLVDSPLSLDAASFEVGFLEMRLSANSDCSGPYSTVFARTSPSRLDMTTGPEIARVTGLPEGDYPCLAMRISDQLRYAPIGTDGACMDGVVVSHDIYRLGGEDRPFVDIDGGDIPPRGSEATPVEDFVWVFATTNEAGVLARGYGLNQVLPLTGPLTVPGSTTFFFDVSGGLADQDGFCETVGGQIGFR